MLYVLRQHVPALQYPHAYRCAWRDNAPPLYLCSQRGSSWLIAVISGGHAFLLGAYRRHTRLKCIVDTHLKWLARVLVRCLS